jgi:cell division protein FtsB
VHSWWQTSKERRRYVVAVFVHAGWHACQHEACCPDDAYADTHLLSAELATAQEVQQLMQERDEATAQVTQLGQQLSKVRAEQKAIVDARNKHEKKCVHILCWCS